MRRFGVPSNIDDCMKDYAVQAGSPATKVVPGKAIPLTDDEFYDQVLADNPEQGNSRFIITKAIEKTKLFQRFVGTHSTSGDRMVDTLLQNAHALLRVRGYQKIKVHQAFSALCAMVAFEGKHKLLMQVATGEGKTDISRLVASCINKLYKTKVDIATSSKTLAEEEAESSQKFYKEVGIVAQNGIDSYKSNEDKKTHVYISSDVMFGTASEFSFNILRDKLNNLRYTPDSNADKTLQSLEGKYFCDCRPGAYLIVDEVDHMFIDDKSSTCRLVTNRKEFNKFDLLACIIWTGVQELFDEIKPPTPKEAISKIIEYVEKSKVFVEKLKLKHLDLERWEACKRLYSRLAYQARFELHADVSYVVANNKITIVDVNSTGELKINSTYGRYLHTFLEMKHHLPSTRQNNCAAAKTACGFYDDYGSRIFGITGTLGGKSCIDFLKKSYGVEIIRVPKCNKNKMINYEPIPGVTPVSGCASASQELLDFCYNSLRMGRPCLVISRTIKEANELSKFVPGYLKDRYKKDHWSDDSNSNNTIP
jgi:preprotein translocase subunit SecA